VRRTDRGFWNNPEATAERIVDGWVETGDIGRLDADGYLYMLDRADDMVISGGLQHLSGRAGERDRRPLDVVEVAVFGIVDERGGEVCVKGEAAVTEKELVELCAVHLGDCKRPGKVVLRRDPSSKTPGGKIKR